MLIFALFLTFLILSHGKIRRNNDILVNDEDQFSAMSQEIYHLSNYDITFWIRRLQVEQYAFLENRDYFYNVFVELDDLPFIMKIINSYYAIKLFFQLHNCSIFNFGNLHSLRLTEFRKFNYMLAEVNNYSAPKVLDINEIYLSIDDYFQKNISICTLEKGLNNNSRKSNGVFYNNDFKEILLVTPKYMKSMRSLGRHLLQSINHDRYGYGNTDYSAEGNKFAYQEYRRYKDSIMSENKDEIENDGENNDDDDDDDDEDNDDDNDEEEDYEIDDETAGKEENDNIENLEEEEDNEVTDTESTVEYHDYETNGHDASLGIIHKTQIQHFIRLIIILILIICWI
ncbi:PREDICTED: serine/threonine-protein kinase rio2-like isoform X2 [Polistes canadensis]|uniref:serine/threonine-protein kinase rio2-like isoform X2 n=1 Tax=Polistes canadensis TaxID=91411 RepID=UPI000718BEE8|nr:PREDICTED: serine/threonine-protein kinase rio2-like isoform X2 [Polistes canadensis]